MINTTKKEAFFEHLFSQDYRKINKRGQGWELGTILLLIVGVVVVVLIILGATGAFDFIFSKTEQIPGQALQTIVAGCKIAAETSLIADYCYEFRELTDTEYINCDDGRVTDTLRQEGVSITFRCNETLVDNAQRQVCGDTSKVREGDKDKTRVGGELCSNILSNTTSS